MESIPAEDLANNGCSSSDVSAGTDKDSVNLPAVQKGDGPELQQEDLSSQEGSKNSDHPNGEINEMEKCVQKLSDSTEKDSESVPEKTFAPLNVQSVFNISKENAVEESSMDMMENISQDNFASSTSNGASQSEDVTMKDNEDSFDIGPPVLEKMVASEKSTSSDKNEDCADDSSIGMDQSFLQNEGTSDTCTKNVLEDNKSNSEVGEGEKNFDATEDSTNDMEVDQDQSKTKTLEESENSLENITSKKQVDDESDKSADKIVAEMDTEDSHLSEIQSQSNKNANSESKNEGSDCNIADGDRMVVERVDIDNCDSQSASSSAKDAKMSKEEPASTFNLLNIKIKTEKPDYDYEGTDLPKITETTSAECSEPLKKPKEEKDKNTAEKDESTNDATDVRNKSNKTNEEDSKKRDADMKGYITDTMNELLGLFGYDKVDENLKDKLDVGKVSKPAKSDDASKAPQKTDSAKKDAAANRVCSECGVTKGLKYQVLFQGTTRFMCSDTCFQKFRGKQKLALPQQNSSNDAKETCAVCHKEIRNGQGFLPSVADSKPLCSEECMQKYQQIYEPKWECVECKANIQSRSKCLMWETMEFCSEDCLGKYQSYLGSHCACCQAPVQRPSLGKYCVRFGLDIRQFCSGRCLEDFKKGLKVCTFCQKDLSNSPDGFVAPVGDKGKFKDFCSQQCMERYEVMNSTGSTPMQLCSVCKKMAPLKVKVNYEGKSHILCSDPCIAAFRYTNKISTTLCDTCHTFFKGGSKMLTLQFEGSSKRFCTKNCINLFVLSHRKIVPCSWCKVKKYNFDMIERVDSNNHVQLFCSLNCLSLFRVSLNASSSRTIRCDHCHQLAPAQYHLTMSDASIRNFCTYQCVMQFQSQFGTVPVLTTTGSSSTANKVTTTTPQGVKSQPQTTSLTPVISSVMSLAPNQKQGFSTPVPVSQYTAPSLTAKINNMRQPVSQTTTTPVKPAAVGTNQAVRDVVVKPPPPRLVKNKGILCRPFVMSKAVSCKPLPCHKSTQTDETGCIGKPSLITVPVPIYVPVPMHMYSRPVPTPLPFPLPIPVPIFIPTSKGTAPEIFKHIKEIQEKIPDNPFEAELLMMAEMVAADTGAPQAEKSDEGKEMEQNQTSSVGIMLDETCHSRAESASVHSFGEENSHDSFFASDIIEPLVDLEAVLDQQNQLPLAPTVELKELSDKAEEDDLVSPRELRARQRSVKRSSRSSRESVRLRSRKRQKLEENYYEDTSSTEATMTGNHEAGSFAELVSKHHNVESVGMVNPICESNMCLKYTFGVNAWKHWVVEKNAQLEKGSQSSRKLKLFKTDLLQLTADELNYSLCLFVKEVRKPNGDEYAPDSIYYLCLGIQQYLFENGRIDNIFMDSYYEKFTECLNEVLQKQEMLVDADGFFMTRIEEEILWESKQLGAHSPHVLLNTLMYFSTKYFVLKTVEDHLCLSFSHVVKHWRKSSSSKPPAGPRNVLLRYYPPINKDSRKKKEDQVVYEQSENLENPLRCPVRLYEFYLSKCPESVKVRNDIFYLHPERSCVPDSPVWYSTQPLGKETIAKMLQRIKMVREIHESHQYRLAEQSRIIQQTP